MGKKKKNRNREAQAPVSSTNIQIPKPPPSFSIPKKTYWILSLVLAALAFFLYAGSINHDYAYDDMAVVKENRFVNKGVSGIKEILTTQYFEGYDPNTNAGAYRPVSLISFAIEKELFGLKPQPHHAINILLYALTAFVLFSMLLKLLRNYHWSFSFITTLLFIIHPVHVDVVANIKSRDEIFGFLNFSLAVLFLLRDREKPTGWNKFLSFSFFFLSLASKESYLTTLACIPLILYFFRDLSWGRIVRITAPYLGIFLLFLLIRSSMIKVNEENISSITYLDNPIMAAQNYGERVGTNIYALGLYLKTLVFPAKLSCDYSYNSIPVTGTGNPEVILYLLIYLALFYIAIKGFKKKNIFSFCILWFLVTISIVSSVFIMSSNAYADRFLYLPSLSICMALGYALTLLARPFDLKKIAGRQWAPLGVLLIILIACTIKILTYVPVWKDDLTLFAYNLKVNPQNARMHKNYGGELVRQAMFMRTDTAGGKKADTATINRYCREGIIELEKAKAIYSREAVGYIHEANAYIILNNFAAAEQNLRSALQIDNNNRFANKSLGYILYMSGRYREAATTWEQINPDIRDQSDQYNLFLAYSMLGDQQKANYYKRLSGQ